MPDWDSSLHKIQKDKHETRHENTRLGQARQHKTRQHKIGQENHKTQQDWTRLDWTKLQDKITHARRRQDSKTRQDKTRLLDKTGQDKTTKDNKDDKATQDTSCFHLYCHPTIFVIPARLSIRDQSWKT